MKITIDLRSLSSGSISGVENYIVNVLEHMLQADNKNSYTLFYNSWKKNLPGEFHFVNSRVKRTFVPNKILNLAFKTGLVNMEKLAGECDWFFMPNLNQYHLNSNTKLAITVHDLSPVVSPEFYDVKRRIWHLFLNYKKAFERANVIFAVSEYTKSDIVRLFGIPEQKIKVVYPGIDPLVYNNEISVEQLRSIRNTYELPGKFILFLNTIEPRKNLSNLIKAFEQFNGDEYLVIAGKAGWKTAGIFKDIKNSKKSAKIKYIGYIPEGDKSSIIKLSRALIYPSFYEGFGFQPLEAMALGVPVVASSVTSIPEIVRDAALLINPYQVSEIAQALSVITSNELVRDKFIAKGLKRAPKFTWEKTVEEIIKNLKESA